ncbi:hypothetical protein OSTOST_14088, partial [Ostertagia ostertagi]
YISTHKFKVSEADKVAIRPTYEKYRYETPGDDVYDDEYDDGYEQKEFTVEPLNAQISSDESEGESTDEPVVGDAGKPRGGGRRPTVQKYYPRTQLIFLQVVRITTPRMLVIPEQNTSRGSSYTGGRQRQMKERHKNAFKQRGADRKMRGAY